VIDKPAGSGQLKCSGDIILSPVFLKPPVQKKARFNVTVPTVQNIKLHFSLLHLTDLTNNKFRKSR
jgi:hypothetical protein